MTSDALHDKAAEANKVKEIVLRALVQEGYLAKEKADDFLSKYAIIEHRKGWLGTIIDKLLPKDSKSSYYRIIKILF